MSKTEILATFFVASGIDPSNTRKFVAIDAHSGGYPWWTDRVQQAEKYGSFERAHAEAVNSMNTKNMLSTGVVKIEYLATIYDAEDVRDINRDKLMAERQRRLDELAAIEQELKEL